MSMLSCVVCIVCVVCDNVGVRGVVHRVQYGPRRGGQASSNPAEMELDVSVCRMSCVPLFVSTACRLNVT